MEYYPTAQVTFDAIAEHLPKLEAAAKEQVFAPQHIVVESLAKANGKNTAGEAELTSVTLTVTITNEENQQAARDRIAEEDRIPLENILMPVLTSVPENAETREHRPRRVPLVPKVENEMERAEGSE
jgi:hypothetical protein